MDGPVDLGWITKGVRFDDADITDSTTVGGMPIPSLTVPITTGPIVPPGVPGVLGRLSGTIPIPMPVSTGVTLDVAVDARFRVRDEDGRIIGDVTWTLGAGPSAVAGSGGEIAPPPGRGLDPLTLAFSAIIVELTTTPAPTGLRTIAASIRLSAGGYSTDWIELSPVAIPLPTVPAPTILMLFQHTQLEGRSLVVVPASSPLDEDTFRGALSDLETALNALGGLVGLAAFFVNELSSVDSALDSADITFRKADQISSLNNIDLESGLFNDTEAEDELSSLVFVGPPGRRAECFNARDQSDDEGQMDVTLGGELMVLIGNLHSASPASNPAGRVDVPATPSGTRWGGLDPWQDITGFGDEFSSLRFSWT